MHTHITVINIVLYMYILFLFLCSSENLQSVSLSF